MSDYSSRGNADRSNTDTDCVGLHILRRQCQDLYILLGVDDAAAAQIRLHRGVGEPDIDAARHADEPASCAAGDGE